MTVSEFHNRSSEIGAAIGEYISNMNIICFGVCCFLALVAFVMVFDLIYQE